MQDDVGDVGDVGALCCEKSMPLHFVVKVQKIVVLNVLTHPILGTKTVYEAQ